MTNVLNKLNVMKVVKLGMLPGLLILASTATFADATSIKVGALVSGQVSKLYVTEGQVVKAGDKLLELDASRYYAKLKLLRAQQEMAKLTLSDAKIELNQALDLYDRTVTSKRTLDASQLRYDTAKAAYDKATAEVALHQAWSKYVFIKAPIDAKVVKIYAPVGTTVFKENTPMLELQPE